MEAPIKYAYWVEEGRLLAGEYPLEHLQALLDAGVTAFIDLTRPGESSRRGDLPPYREQLEQLADSAARHLPFPIPDMRVPSEARTAEILDAIDAELSAGGIPYVHCRAGVGRTGTIIGCWLARHGERGDAALERLAALWEGTALSEHFPRTPENDLQHEYVRDWGLWSRGYI